MNEAQIISLLTIHKIKATANRILIVRELMRGRGPMSMKELEYKILTLEKSSISRSLSLFKDNHLVHVIDDGTGTLKYELCYNTNHNHDSDEHVHFFCNRCKQITCLHNVPLPRVQVPNEYSVEETSYIIKGICAKCKDTK